MSYDVLVFTMTDADVFRGADATKDGRLRMPPPGFAADLPIEHHDLPWAKLQIWLQRITPKAMTERIQKIAISCDERGVASTRTLTCPHDEPAHGADDMYYLGFELRFCHDCAMIMAGEFLESEGVFLKSLDAGGKFRHHDMQRKQWQWMSTRRINWVHCGGPVVSLEPYKKQMGF